MSDLPDLVAERRLWAQGYAHIAGLDEAGRGAWAGPVVAAAVVLPAARDDIVDVLAGVRDSKLMTPRQRERCYGLIVDCAISFGVGAVGPDRIDDIGIVPATRLAMAEAVASLTPLPDYLLIDALRLPDIDLPQLVEAKADRHHLSVAAASVLAKVSRDRLMVALDRELPGYGMARHKGYGTAVHREALERLGPAQVHRQSFAPIRALRDATEGCAGGCGR